MNGRDGAAYLGSFLVHLLLLAALAIPVIRGLQEPELPTTILIGDQDSDAESDTGIIGASIGTSLDLAPLQPPPNEEARQDNLQSLTHIEMGSTDIDPEQVSALRSQSAASNGTGSDNSGKGRTGNNGSGLSGVRTAEPANVIRAGSFSVWAWPIIGKDIQGNILHAAPGSSPKVFQDYHIVIRLKVPHDRKTVRLGDFGGEVVGTDQYRQKIPQDAWFFNLNGDLIGARTGRHIPVIDGTAELLIRVPGAGTARVRDTITVTSRLVDEEQTIELVFGGTQDEI
jgi:hypothetical protein